jgi:hypothetical protein
VNFVYGQRWNDPMRFIIDAISEEQARVRFQTGPYFTVAKGEGLLTDSGQARVVGVAAPVPEYSLDMTAGAENIRANFYTTGGSLGALYHWRQEKERMFLHQVSVYQYPDDEAYYGQDEALVFTSISFTVDGFSKTYIDDKSKSMIDLEDRCEVPLDAHWEPIPAFGEWDAFGVLRRKQAPPPSRE